MGLICDVFKAILRYEGETIGVGLLQNANIEVQTQNNDLRADRGGNVVAVIHGAKDINITLTTADMNYAILSRILGQNITTGAGIAYHMPITLTASGATPKISLPEVPLATDHRMVVYKADGTKVSTFTVSGSDVTFTTGVVAGEEVTVAGYRYNTSAQTQTIDINASSFPKDMEVILETLEVTQGEVVTHRIQYQFNKVIPDGNFSINTASERNAVTQDLTLRVLKPFNSDIMGKVLRIPVSA